MMTRVLVLGGSSYVAQFILQRHLAAACGSEYDSNSFVMACTMRGQQASSSPLPAGFVSVSTTTAPSSPAASSSSQVRVYWDVDLGTMAAVRECIRHFRPDVIINCVAMSSPAACEKEPARAKAINEPRELVEFIGEELEWKVRFVHFSTLLTVHHASIDIVQDFVYDGANPPPHGYKESDAVESLSSSSSSTDPASLTVYGASKLRFDAFLLAQQGKYANLSGLVLRIANVIGPQAPLFADHPPKFMEWLHQKLFYNASKDKETLPPQLRLWSDEVRSFIYVRDLAAIVFELLERSGDDSFQAATPTSSPHFLLLNIGGIDALSRVELAERYCDACQRINPQGTTPHAAIAPTSRTSVDLGYHPPLNACLNTARLRQQLPSLALTPTDRIMDEISRELLTQ